MNGEFKLLWATDVGAQLEAEHMGMEVFANKTDADASVLVAECGETAIPIIVFVPSPSMTEDQVLATRSMLEVFNDLNAAFERTANAA